MNRRESLKTMLAAGAAALVPGGAVVAKVAEPAVAICTPCMSRLVASCWVFDGGGGAETTYFIADGSDGFRQVSKEIHDLYFFHGVSP